MTAGTKIFLAVFALLVGLLVLYYGIITPGTPDLPIETARTSTQTTPDPASASTDVESAPAAPRDVDIELPQRQSDPPPRDVPTNDRITGAGTSGVEPPVVHQSNDVAATVEERIEDAPPPVRETTAAPPTPRPEPTYYIVQSDDTLSGIASWWFGDANRWDEIARANPAIDPDDLDVGQKLTLPMRGNGSADARRRTTQHVVRSDDTLSSIAREYYDDSGKWRVIYAANRRVIGSNPDRLDEGITLTIPASD